MYLNSILYLFHGHADEYSIPELLSVYTQYIRERDEAAAVIEAHDIFAGIHIAGFAVIDFIDGQTGGGANGTGTDFFSFHKKQKQESGAVGKRVDTCGARII